MERILLIYNPVSGKSINRENRIGKIVMELGKADSEVVAYQTKEKNDGRRYLMENDIDKYSCIVVCGGDGTLHEMVGAILEKNYTGDIGYVPLGSTNDYANNLGIKRNNAIRNIIKRRKTQIDVGKLNDEYFNYVACFGAFTEVTYTTPQNIKNGIGYLAYLLMGVKSVADVKPIEFRCKTDHEMIEDKVIIGMITNALSVGGVKIRDKYASLNDGEMEYVFIKYPQHILDIQNTILALVNFSFDEKYMYYGHSSSFSIESDVMNWNLDGENGGSTDKAEIVTCPGALNIIVGK